MAAAVRDGTISFSFLDASAFDRFAELSVTTFQELSDRTGIPMDLLKVVREAVGFAEPQPEDHVREDELAVVPVIELQLSTGLRPIMIGRWLRVCADSLRRITETETDWYRTARGFAGGIGRRANYARARSTSPPRRQPDVAPFSPPRATRRVMNNSSTSTTGLRHDHVEVFGTRHPILEPDRPPVAAVARPLLAAAGNRILRVRAPPSRDIGSTQRCLNP